MKIFFYIFIFSLLLFFTLIPSTFASTLYSSNFTPNSTFWNTFYNSCSTSSSGLTCSNPADAVNTIHFPTLACVSGKFTSNGGPNQLFILDNNTNFNSYVVMYIHAGHNLELNSNINTVFDSNTLSPSSGIHTYTLCKSSDIYTSYVDTTLVQTQTFPGHTGGYIGFQTANGEFLTDFIATSTLPSLPNQTVLYLNTFNSDFWNTFFGTCNTSSSGLICTNTAVLNTSQFPTLKCMAGNFNSTIGNPQLLLAEDPHLIQLFAIDFNNNSDILIKDLANNNIHTGVLVPTGIHKFEVCQDINQLNIYIDSSLAYTYNGSFSHLDYAGFAFDTGTTLINFTVTDTNPYGNLNVPLLKQTNPTWGSQVYDGANNWDPLHKTIGDWGCAMTSAAMILQSHGINKMPDGTALNPGTLNTWLKNQSDGYIDGISSGYMNPLAITRLAKQAVAINNITAFDALEYQHISGENKTQLTSDLNNNQPDMLEEPGHFIVATGVNGNTFAINDPYYSRTDLTNGYNNSFLSLNRYIPSHTDLSYIMLAVNPNVTVMIKDSIGNVVGDQFTQQPYADPLNNNTTRGNPLKMIFLPKPTNGIYQITLSGNTTQTYQLHTYLYDQGGNVHTDITKGTISQNLPDVLTVNFNKQNSKSSIANRIVTFQSFIDDVNENVKLQQINKSLSNALIPLIKSAKESVGKNQKLAAKLKLDAIEITLKLFCKKGISDSAFQIFLYDVTYLINHL